MKFWTHLLAGFALGVVAIAEDDIWSKTINNDSNGTWNILPDKPKPKYFEVKGIPGEHAFRIKASKGVNPWDVQASSPIQGAINEGDVIMLMYYARAEEPAAEPLVPGTALAAEAGAPPEADGQGAYEVVRVVGGFEMHGLPPTRGLRTLNSTKVYAR